MKKIFALFTLAAILFPEMSCRRIDPGDDSLTAIHLDKTEVTLFVGETDQLTVTLIPDTYNESIVVWSSSDEKVATVSHGQIKGVAAGKATITASEKNGTVKSECQVRVRNHCPEGAVDMGLDVYWATCNLCESGFVSSPEKYGDYYAWGETKSKTSFSNSNYTFYDEPETLPLSADAAHVILGARWRMPTYEECEALFENCDLIWKASQAGVTGGLFTSKITGNSIFLPAAGEYFSHGTEVGNYGFYRSSSSALSFGGRNPYSIWLVSWTGMRDISNLSYSGQSIRPVSE